MIDVPGLVLGRLPPWLCILSADLLSLHSFPSLVRSASRFTTTRCARCSFMMRECRTLT